jgi:hypothetical protein
VTDTYASSPAWCLDELKVLYMSGYLNDLTTPEGMLDPEVIILTKPFSTLDLLTKVRAAIDKMTAESDRWLPGMEAGWVRKIPPSAGYWLLARAASNSSPRCHPISLGRLAASQPKANPKRAMAELPTKSISGWYSSLGW